MLDTMTVPGGRTPHQGPPRPRSKASEAAPASVEAPATRGSGQVSRTRPRVLSDGKPSGDSQRAPSSIPETGDPLRDALVSTRRYGATLNGLLSAIDSFARGVEAARNANDALARKLESVQDLVHSSERASELRQGDLERRVQQLEQKLRTQRKTFEEERRFLTEEQDEFLRALLEEHEEQVATLRQERDAARRGEAGEAPAEQAGDALESLRREVAALRAERESSRSLVERMRAQRDQAQAALRRAESRADGAHPTTPAPPPFAASVSLRVPPAPRAPTELAEGLPEAPFELEEPSTQSGKDDRAG